MHVKVLIDVVSFYFEVHNRKTLVLYLNLTSPAKRQNPGNFHLLLPPSVPDQLFLRQRGESVTVSNYSCLYTDDQLNAC